MGMIGTGSNLPTPENNNSVDPSMPIIPAASNGEHEKHPGNVNDFAVRVLSPTPQEDKTSRPLLREVTTLPLLQKKRALPNVVSVIPPLIKNGKLEAVAAVKEVRRASLAISSRSSRAKSTSSVEDSPRRWEPRKRSVLSEGSDDLENELSTDDIKERQLTPESGDTVISESDNSVENIPAKIFFDIKVRTFKYPPELAQNVSKAIKDGEWKALIKPNAKPSVRKAEIKKIQKQRNEYLKDFCTNKKPDKHGDIKPTLEDVQKALIRFKTDYKGSWAVMKESDTCPKGLMQIINDTRAYKIKDTIEKVKIQCAHLLEGKNLRILDFGSSNLTSDRDFAFTIEPRDLALEAILSRTFNNIWEETYGLTSAENDDCNAYQSIRVLTCDDKNIEATREAQSINVSRANMLKILPPELRDKFISKFSTLKASSSSVDLIKQEFDDVKANEFKVRQGICLKCMESGLESILEKYDVTHHDELNIENLEESEANFIEKYKEIEDANYYSASNDDEEMVDNSYDEMMKGADPREVENLRVTVENRLLEEYKTGLQDLEIGIGIIETKLNALDNHSTPALFIENYNKIILEAIRINQERLDITQNPAFRKQLENEIQRLETNKVTNSTSSFKKHCMDAFNVLNPIRSQIRSINTDILQLESISKEFRRLTSSTPRDKDKISQLMGDLAKLGVSVKRGFFTSQFNNDKIIESNIQGKIKTHRQKLQDTENKIEKAKNDYGEDACNIAMAASNAKDHMHISLEQAQKYGILNLQEAHTPNAASVVVGILQAGSIKKARISEAVPALIEVGAYFLAHQSKVTDQDDAMAKLIECSKYGKRLGPILNMLTERSAEFGVKAPDIDAKEMKKTSTLMNALFEFRGKGYSSEYIFNNSKEAIAAYKGINPKDVTPNTVKNALEELNDFVLENILAKTNKWVDNNDIQDVLSLDVADQTFSENVRR